MSDHPEQTADDARALVDQAQSLARAENYAEAFHTLLGAVAIYERLSAAPNGAPVGGVTVPLGEYQQLQAKYESCVNVLLATFPTGPEWTQQEIDKIEAGKWWVPFEQVLAELERPHGDQG